ncbi:hypothetical protein OEZ86_010613 [Tetradesmus obliquus]|uniref:Uncharacterized protein n=1 Tax=Tetradesmus obliquus TaxID=3088 RepID=A0ABY8TI18_TETOB|nr:hypothetical protein OEZ85_007431 [Tetradesmus obliquus]WIA28026.1 hypothetical protein OEZ86_010613 [Tetradesmus obliquus]
MSFSIGDDFTPALLPRAGFNVLYVETPRIGLLQTPEFQLLAETWQETVELVKPLLRFGFPETSLRTKCPYYNEDLHATPSGCSGSLVLGLNLLAYWAISRQARRGFGA